HPVLHHELLAQQFSHLRAHDARDGVGRPTGGERDDHANRFGRIFLLGIRGRAHERERHDEASESGHQSIMPAHHVSPTFEAPSLNPTVAAQSIRMLAVLMTLPHFGISTLIYAAYSC